MSRLLLYILLIVGISQAKLSSQVSDNQGFTINEAPRKAQKLYAKLSKENYRLDSQKRLKLIDKILDQFPQLVDAHTEKAFTLYKQGKPAEARTSLETSISLKPDYQAKRYLILANYCKELEDLDCENDRLKQFLQLNPTSKLADKIEVRIEQYASRKLIADKFSNLPIENISSAINSKEYPEYKPVLSVDEQEMIFTRRVNGQEDFYRSIKDESGNWLNAEPVIELNTPGNEGAHAVSPDGKFIIFTRCDAPKRYRSCDLYISQRAGDKWSEAQFMTNINTEAWESQAAFSPDGNTIYFSSSKNGNRDLYSISIVNGVWQDVVSLGNTINTTGNEESPYLHPDGRTLYFMSNGHAGLGGMDLFLSKKLLDGSWSTPINMGGSINTSADEGGLFVDVRGEYAYFSKTQKKEQDLDSDIYRFRLPNEFKPDPVTYLKVLVHDGKTKKAISAKMQLKHIAHNSIQNYNIDPSGKLLVIKQATDYSLYIEKEGYTFHSERIDNNLRSEASAPVIFKIDLYPLEETAIQDTTPPVSLRNILFESGEAKLIASSNEELNRLVLLLGSNPKKNILLNGHTDNVGNPEDNVILSQQRAEAVKKYLINSGISETRIFCKAYGENQPIASNDTSEGRALNRRIEFQLINPI